MPTLSPLVGSKFLNNLINKFAGANRKKGVARYMTYQL